MERDEYGQQPCRRGTWCASSTIVYDQPDGSGRRVPSYGPRPFCDRDAPLVACALEELPGQYAHLHAELGNPAVRAQSVRVPFGPRVPIRIDVDTLMSAIASSLVSAGMSGSPPSTTSHFPEGRLARHRRDGHAVQRAVDVMAVRMAALIALPPEPMMRAVDFRDLADLPDSTPGVVHAGFAEVVVDLDGGDAGMEILVLRHLCRAVLGETRSRPEELIGVPCRADGCGLRALARAEPPSDPADPGSYSECQACGDRMTDKDYGDWSRCAPRTNGTALRCPRPWKTYRHLCCECRRAYCKLKPDRRIVPGSL